jgi:hypothetical protein
VTKGGEFLGEKVGNYGEAAERGRTRSKLGFSEVWIEGENRGVGGGARSRCVHDSCMEKEEK